MSIELILLITGGIVWLLVAICSGIVLFIIGAHLIEQAFKTYKALWHITYFYMKHRKYIKKNQFKDIDGTLWTFTKSKEVRKQKKQ